MSTFDSLNDTFDIVPNEAPPKPEKKSRAEVTHKDKDYDYARAELYDLVEMMKEGLQGALEVAQQSDHPRAYEVFNNGAKNTSEVIEKITDLHKKMKDLETIEEVRVQQHNSTTTNNVFMSGSTAELMKMLKESQAQ